VHTQEQIEHEITLWIGKVSSLELNQKHAEAAAKA
jgi:hypothetical protein